MRQPCSETSFRHAAVIPAACACGLLSAVSRAVAAPCRPAMGSRPVGCDEHVSSRSLRAPCVEGNSGKSLAGLCGAYLAELSQAHPLLVVETRKRAAAV